MKKDYELIAIFPYLAENNGRYVHTRNIWTGWVKTEFYPISNKRKLVQLMRKNGVFCPHYVYRG